MPERWWERGCLYQVYVRSFADSDGDGSGDLPGLIDRLDHLAWLGVDGVWLSPTMPSPDRDWGYDVADYRSVHPDLGSLADLERLVVEAGRRGMAVLLDLVPNHTSSAHPWFVEAAGDRHSPRRDWYVWADPAPDGGPPNNWLDATGASAWSFEERTGQYYLHNFLPGQPDLNWWNDEVRGEFEEILRYWFDRGIAGVRIDVAHALHHDLQLRDNPPAPEGPASRFGQEPVYSMNRPEVHGVYRSWRKLADEYRPERLLLGETWVLDPQRLASFYGDDDELHLGLNIGFIFSEFTAPALASTVAATMAALPPEAVPVWCGSNHDISRMATRWAAGDDRRTRLALAVLCTLPGTVVLYQGDELGLTDVDIPPGRQRDPMTWRATDRRFNRDRARTPMPWEPGPNYGFGPAGAEPWLPLGDRDGVTVAEQFGDEGSVLWLTRSLMALHHRYAGRRDYRPLPAGTEQWVFRSGELVVATNFSAAPVTVDVPEGDALLSTDPDGPAGRRGGAATPLGPWEALILHDQPGPDAAGSDNDREV